MRAFLIRQWRPLSYAAMLAAAALIVALSQWWAHAHEPGISTEEPYADTAFLAVVDSIDSSGVRNVPTTRTDAPFQDMTVHIVSGARAGKSLAIENDTWATFKAGDRFYLHRTTAGDGSDQWAVGEPDRALPLGLLIGLFALTTILVAGVVGLRALIALAGSFALIIYALVPLLFAGAPPIAASLALSVAVLTFSMYVTHGINRVTSVALGASMLALLCAALVAQVVVGLAKMTGYVSDETVFLNLATHGTIDLKALLLAGVLVGIVGILNDISVSQAHTVAEISAADPSLGRFAVWKRAQRVGQEHAGAVVTMLPLAYAGAALPLLMLFANTDAPLAFIANREMFSAEIIRALSGGIGLLLAGAIATLGAVMVLVPSRPRL